MGLARLPRRSWLIQAILAVLIGLSVLPAQVRAQTEGAQPPTFGVVRAPGSVVPVPEALGVTWERVTFEWAALQPDGPGEFVAEAVDPAVLADARAAGREIVGLIVGTPEWAAGPRAVDTVGAVPRGLALAADDPANLWAVFVTQLAETYGPQGVTRWIVYDAPDVRRGEGRVQFAGDEADYARLLSVAWAALDAVDPGIEVIAGAVDGWADAAAGREPYLARLLRALTAQGEPLPFEAVVVRATAGTQDVWDRLSQARAILDAAGHDGVALWLEAGMVADPAALLGVSAARQADFIAQAAVISRAAGAERFAAYTLADGADGLAWGLTEADGTPRPALAAYQAVIDLLGTPETFTHEAHLAADVILAEAGGRLVVMAWARGDWPVELRVTSPAVGEAGALIAPGGVHAAVQSGADEWPAAFVFALTPPERDGNGFLTVAGAPCLLVLEAVPVEAGDFYRVVWLVVNGEYIRLR